MDHERGRSRKFNFTVSVPGSENSSRASSPVPSPAPSEVSFDLEGVPSPGRRSTDVYDAVLPWWRAAVRRKLLVAVQRESKVIARMQVKQALLPDSGCCAEIYYIRILSVLPGSTFISSTPHHWAPIRFS